MKPIRRIGSTAGSRANKTKFFLVGGLGNQLFILAAGLYFQEKHARKVVFDLGDLEYGLTKHPASILELGPLDSIAIKKPAKFMTYLSRILKKMFLILGERGAHYVSPRVGFDESLSLPLNVKTIRGYFQTWKYVADPKVKKFLKDLTIKKPSDWYLNELDLMNAEDVIGVHVRLGDYKSLSSTFGNLEGQYFFEAINLAIQKSKTAARKLVIFSDDIEEAQELLHGFDFNIPIRFIKPPKESTHAESLFLLAQSKILVMSNSSFSWWAATLGREKSLVIYPQKWFKDMDDPADLTPNSWLAIEAHWKK